MANPRSSAYRRDEPAAVPDVQLVSFYLAGEEYALEILRVQEIIRVPNVTRVPNSPDFVEGVINLRGRILPIISLRRRVGLEAAENTANSRVIVVDIQGTTLGMIVDAVAVVLRVRQDRIEPPPRLRAVEREYVGGVAKLDKRLLLILDLDYILSQSEQSAVGSFSAEQGGAEAS